MWVLISVYIFMFLKTFISFSYCIPECIWHFDFFVCGKSVLWLNNFICSLPDGNPHCSNYSSNFQCTRSGLCLGATRVSTRLAVKNTSAHVQQWCHKKGALLGSSFKMASSVNANNKLSSKYHLNITDQHQTLAITIFCK